MNSSTPRVSVILPFWNSEKTLSIAVESILNQTEKNIELIAVNDRSDDKSAEIIQKYAAVDKRIILASTDHNASVGGARNLGLNLTRANLVSFVDSDDWIDTDFIGKLSYAIENDRSEIAICGVKHEFDSPFQSRTRYNYPEQNVISGNFALSLLTRVRAQNISIGPAVTSKMFKLEFIRQSSLKFLENSINEDDVFTFQSFILANRVSIVSNTYYHLFQRKNSLSRQFSQKHLESLFFAFEDIKKNLQKQNLYLQYKQEYFSYFEKNLSYVIEIMKKSEMSSTLMEKNTLYILKNLKRIGPDEEVINYLGHNRVLAFFRSF